MATEVTKIVDPDNGAGTDYTSLAALVAGYAKNLVTDDEQLTIKCRCTGGTADGAVTVNGFTTDATRFIKIWTDPSESYRWTGGGNTYPASGNYYRIESADNHGLVINDDNVDIYGIAFGLSVSGANIVRCVLVETVGVATFNIGYCYFNGISVAGTGAANGVYCFDTTATVNIFNCAINGFISADNPTDTGFAGIFLSSCAAARIYNCSISKCYYGIRRSGGTVSSYNDCVFNNTDDFNGIITADYCASDDGDGTNAVDISPGATEADDWAEVFTDYANGDFSLKNFTGTQKVIGMGTDNPGSGLYSDDIIGTARSSTWDIGAFEYVAATPPETGSPQMMMMGMG